MQKHDKIRFKHMLDAIEEALSFVKNPSRESLDNDRQLVLALIKDIEIVGEAAAGFPMKPRVPLLKYPGPA